MTMHTQQQLERTLAAETRAIEEGHRAFLAGDGTGAVTVVSDTHDRTKYRVEYKVRDAGLIVFTCDDPIVQRLGEAPRFSARPGLLPCKHAGVCARRLERHGLAEWHEGVWRVPPKMYEQLMRPALADLPTDPFAGFPKL